MDSLTLIIVAAAAIGATCYLTGWWLAVITKFASLTERASVWVTSPDGARSDLCREIPLRDIYDDLLETEGNWMWVAADILPVPTDGFSPEDWERIDTGLNWVITTLSPGTRIQTLTQVSTNIERYSDVHRRNASTAIDAGFELLELERARFLEREAEEGRLKSVQQFVLIGRRTLPVSIIREGGIAGLFRFGLLKLKGLLGISYHIELQASEVIRTYEELNRERARFCEDFGRSGGAARAIDMRRVWQRYYERLNPEEAALVPRPPAYSWQTNPRTLLCMTGINVRDGLVLQMGEKWATTLSLQGLPSKTYPGVMEALTREIKFDCEISSWVESSDRMLKDEELKEREEFLQVLCEKGQADKDEEAEYRELSHMREMTRIGVECIATIGFGVTITADTKDELRRRKGVVRSLLQQCWGMECSSDSMPVEQWAATLPGGVELDRRANDVRSKNAAALQCWTGGPTGVPAEEALMVFRRADGGLLGYHPDSRLISNAGIEIIVGEAGGGKSGYLNLCRSVAAGQGIRQCSFDFNGSATRVCLAAGGHVIRLASQQIGIFPPWPEHEQFEDSDLTEFGMPVAWMGTLSRMMAQLATDEGMGEAKLPKHLRTLIQRACYQIYQAEAKSGTTPALSELLFVLDHWPDHAESSDARLISNRLREYQYERFLNERTSHLLSAESPYVVFDFVDLLDDPVSAELGAMSAATFVDRFAATDRRIKKRLDGDELDTICSRIPRVAWVFNLTGRNMRKQGGMVAAASQSPLDFERTELRGLRVSSSIRWFFRLANPEEARQVFNLSPGVADLVASLEVGDKTYRPCVLQTPQFVAKLRLAHGPLDRRLLLGAAAQENISMSEVVSHTSNVPASLLAALEADALGAHQSAGR